MIFEGDRGERKGIKRKISHTPARAERKREIEREGARQGKGQGREKKRRSRSRVRSIAARVRESGEEKVEIFLLVDDSLERGRRRKREKKERERKIVSGTIRAYVFSKQVTERSSRLVKEQFQSREKRSRDHVSSYTATSLFIDIESSRPSGRTRRRTGSSGSSVVDDRPG